MQKSNIKLKRQSQALLQKLGSSCVEIDINGGQIEVLEDDSIEKLLAGTKHAN